MFLNQLSTPLKKALFLELSALVMMAAGDDGNPEKLSNRSDNLVLNKFLAGINTAEEAMLNEYQSELFKDGDECANAGREFLENSLYTKGHASFNTELDSYHMFAMEDTLRRMHLGEEEWMNDKEANLPEGRFLALWFILVKSIYSALSKYSDNAAVKQEVMQNLVMGGEDILSLTPEKIQASMASLPKIKQEILAETAGRVIDSKLALGLGLSEKEKKIFICELIGAAYSSGAFEEEEKQLIESICKALGAESEYIEEFDGAMAKLFKANKELADLINE